MPTVSQAETNRFAAVLAARGIEGAAAWVDQTLTVYTRAVLCSRKRGALRPHHASLPEFRPQFLASICHLRRLRKACREALQTVQQG